MSSLDSFFAKLWQQYVAITPQALAIHELLTGLDETPVNDHVAFRTFAHSPFSIACLEPQILALGYVPLADYYFKNKKLHARCYLNAASPTKIFISELLWQELPSLAQGIIEKIIQQYSVSTPPDIDAQRLWALPSYKDYQRLLESSEYAAWLSIWGLRANHFTVYVNHLTHFSSLQSVVDRLLKSNYKFNLEGGVIKGTCEDLLIQAATLADKQDVVFDDAGTQSISSCYYEFAQRFKQKNGELYQGFVPGNADKIFESTDQGR